MIRSATYTAAGEEIRSCSVCGKTETRVIPILIRKEFTVSPSVLELYYKLDNGAKLQASEDNVVWRSGNESVVKVDANGSLTTVKAGVTAVTATTADGDRQATCIVYVRYTWWQKLIRIFLFGWLWY